MKTMHLKIRNNEMLLNPLNSGVHWSKGLWWGERTRRTGVPVRRRPGCRPAPRYGPPLGRTARNSIISVLTQCESDFIPDDSAPLKLAQYCRKQENILREKKYCPRRREENEDGMPGTNRANESRWQYASAFALSMMLRVELLPL